VADTTPKSDLKPFRAKLYSILTVILNYHNSNFLYSTRRDKSVNAQTISFQATQWSDTTELLDERVEKNQSSLAELEY
jgi:hypothetical protein